MVNNAATQLEPSETRLHPRTHLFVVATLYADGRSSPVHVRNMSMVGAQVEGPSLPEPGTPIILKRGSLQARGTVAWKIDRKGGVAFSGAVEVAEWMAKISGPQDQVDHVVSDYRTRPRALGSAPARAADNEQHSVAEELAQLRDDIARLGNSLSGDVIMVATHPEIQVIDIVLQRIDRLIARV